MNAGKKIDRSIFIFQKFGDRETLVNYLETLKEESVKVGRNIKTNKENKAPFPTTSNHQN